MAITAGSDKELKLWDAKRGTMIRTLRGHNGQALDAEISPDGTLVISGGFDYRVRLWSVLTGNDTKELSGHKMPVKRVAFIPNSTRALSTADDGTTRIWDLATGVTLKIHPNSKCGSFISVSADGDRALSLLSGSVVVWNPETGNILRKLNIVNAIAANFSKGQNEVAACSSDGEFITWRISGLGQ